MRARLLGSMLWQPGGWPRCSSMVETLHRLLTRIALDYRARAPQDRLKTQLWEPKEGQNKHIESQSLTIRERLDIWISFKTTGGTKKLTRHCNQSMTNSILTWKNVTLEDPQPSQSWTELQLIMVNLNILYQKANKANNASQIQNSTKTNLSRTSSRYYLTRTFEIH